MKTKLLGVVAACVFALTVGAANANTISFTGTFGPGTDTISFCDISQCPPGSTTLPVQWGGGSLSGTFDYAGDTVTAMNILVSLPLGRIFFLNPNTITTLSQSGSGLSLAVHEIDSFCPCADYQLSLGFDLATSLFSANYSGSREVIPPDLLILGAAWSDAGTFVVTPLPAALPLFATGLGILGLLSAFKVR